VRKKNASIEYGKGNIKNRIFLKKADTLEKPTVWTQFAKVIN